MSEEQRLCDQEDCEYYFYPKAPKETAVEEKDTPIMLMSTMNGTITGNLGITGQSIFISNNNNWNNTISVESLPKSVLHSKVECLDFPIQIECLVCNHFMKCDMNIVSKVFKARQALLGKS